MYVYALFLIEYLSRKSGMQFEEHCFISGYCLPDVKNKAVREGLYDVPMDTTSRSCTVTWSVVPTSNELSPYQITSSDCTVNPSLGALYYVRQSILMIRNTTTTENGQAISTAGLYIAECYKNSENRTGAKLVVIRKLILVTLMKL